MGTVDSPREYGTLSVVASPIGNLEDISIRAIRTLREADYLVAEDSRYTKRLLDRYGIETGFTASYYRGAGSRRRDEIIDQLRRGYDLALISNAGTPLISDPGFKLVRKARELGIEVVGIPGPNAAITCLSIAGQPTDSFVFLGQAPKKVNRKRNLFRGLTAERRTSVLYDSPHRIEKTFEVLAEILPERSTTICREMTKKHEESFKGRAKDLLEKLKVEGVRGEYSIVISGCSGDELKRYRYEANKDIPIAQQLQGMQKLKDIDKKEALKELAEYRGQTKRELYDALNK
ncbi:MAG: 16S rRNA (cytidine(1402)-2'-O)-methyltransferase [Candidatus Acetothermia bacterium]